MKNKTRVTSVYFVCSQTTDRSSPPKLETEVEISESSEDRVIERGARTIVENAHYITVPGKCYIFNIAPPCECKILIESYVFMHTKEGTAAARSYTSLTPVTPSIGKSAF